MSEVIYRPAGDEDVGGAVDVFMTSVAEMAARTGATGIPMPPRAAVETSYRHILRTGIFHVAEDEGGVIAVCHAVVRDRLWFLSAFWALPETQRRRVGGPLLRRVVEEGERAGAKKFFTWSSPDTTAMAAYLRSGMLPGYQILMFAGAPEHLGEPREEFDVRPLELPGATWLDARVRETPRAVDHKYWLSQDSYAGRQVVRRAGGRLVGYFYTANGLVGPAAWVDEADSDALLTIACREAAGRAAEVRLLVPGANHDAIRFALRAGLRLTGFSHLLTSAPFGRMEQYLPSGPALF